MTDSSLSYPAQVNNDINAYEFYTEKGKVAQAEAARQRVASGWATLTQWMAKFLPKNLKCVRESVEKTWLSSRGTK